MLPRKRFPILAIALTVAAAFAQTLTKGVQKVTSVEGITEYSLPNGMRVLLFPYESKANVTVNMSSTQKIKTEEQPKMATTPSDLVMNSGADSMDRSTLINEGAIEPLDDLLTAPAWDSEGTVADTLLPGTVSDGTQNGKFYVVNIAFTVWGNWYNGALFQKEGWQPPTTWDEFFTLAPKIKAKGMAPYVHDAVHGYYPRWALMASIWTTSSLTSSHITPALKRMR